VEREHPVTPLELFFDLVFVFALTQVTAMLADDTTEGGLLHALLVLVALWWAWSAYAWLTNNVDPDGTPQRLVVFTAMAAMLIAALAVPQAFGDEALVFALAYLVVRLAHIGLFLVGAADAAHRRSILRYTPTSILGPGLLVVAAAMGGDAQVVLFAVALALDLAGPYFSGTSGWVLSPGHFAERYALIVIIALGESIVAIGVGAEGAELDAGVLVAATLGVAASAAMWWLYFDVIAVVAERVLHERTGAAQFELARDAYSYLHFLMVAGVVLFALGVKKTLQHTGEELDTVPAVCLAGGLGLYLAGHVLFRLRVRGSVNPQRTAAALACIPLAVVATAVPALAALALTAALACGVVVYEAVRFAETRTQVRAQSAA
jgi:low temperature requirement protein LtrA